MKIPGKYVYSLVDRAAAALGIQRYPGYATPFTRRQALGAIPNGTRVIKISEDPDGDLHPIGSYGVVQGSIDGRSLGIYYFVEWDLSPRYVTSCGAAKIRAAP